MCTNNEGENYYYFDFGVELINSSRIACEGKWGVLTPLQQRTIIYKRNHPLIALIIEVGRRIFDVIFPFVLPYMVRTDELRVVNRVY